MSEAASESLAPERPGAERAGWDGQRRREFVSTMLIMHPELRAVQSALSLGYEEQLDGGEPLSMFIAGDAGIGKSKACSLFARKYGRVVEGYRTMVPVVSVSVPSQATPLSTAREILKGFEDPLVKRTGTFNTLRQEINREMEKLQTRMLLLDEIHNSICAQTHHVLRNLSEWLKTIQNNNRACLVCFGTETAGSVFKYSDEISRRFALRARMDRFHWRATDLRDEFLNFLEAVDRQLPLLGASNLCDPEIAGRLYYASGGNIAHLMSIIRGATKRAIGDGSAHLTMPHMSTAFTQRVLSARPVECNPFTEPSFSIGMAAKEDDREEKRRDDLSQVRGVDGRRLPRLRDVLGA